MRKVLVSVAVVALAAVAAPAQQQPWAAKMFKEGLTHDFGSVPRGAQLLHRFTLTNIYAVRMEITEIKSGCGCVTADATKRVLEPRESTTIDVKMDAHRFIGSKSVAIRVTVGPEFISSAELRVTANCRPDIVFNPGEVNLGTVVRGTTPSQTIDVEYAGSLPWTVSEVVAKDMPLDVALTEMYRRPGKVGYQVRVTLKPDAPDGLLKEDIFLKTNDPGSPLVPILVQASVQPAVSVSPSTLSLGTVKLGELVTRRVVVRGNRPFRVTGVEGTGDGISCDPAGTTPGPVQILTFKFQLAQAGDIKREVRIKTDLQDVPATLAIEGTAN
jgi:hypothetical protein